MQNEAIQHWLMNCGGKGQFHEARTGGAITNVSNRSSIEGPVSAGKRQIAVEMIDGSTTNAALRTFVQIDGANRRCIPSWPVGI